ncbi:MAG: ATP synthase subunit I, partial [Acidobacteriota bacterium]
WGGEFALGVAAGGALALLNYGAIAWMVEGFVRRPSRRARWLAAFGLGARYVLLGLALYVIFAIWRANVLAVSLGLSAPVAAIFVEWGIETYEELGPKS